MIQFNSPFSASLSGLAPIRSIHWLISLPMFYYWLCLQNQKQKQVRKIFESNNSYLMLVLLLQQSQSDKNSYKNWYSIYAISLCESWMEQLTCNIASKPIQSNWYSLKAASSDTQHRLWLIEVKICLVFSSVVEF